MSFELRLKRLEQQTRASRQSSRGRDAIARLRAAELPEGPGRLEAVYQLVADALVGLGPGSTGSPFLRLRPADRRRAHCALRRNRPRGAGSVTWLLPESALAISANGPAPVVPLCGRGVGFAR